MLTTRPVKNGLLFLKPNSILFSGSNQKPPVIGGQFHGDSIMEDTTNSLFSYTSEGTITGGRKTCFQICQPIESCTSVVAVSAGCRQTVYLAFMHAQWGLTLTDLFHSRSLGALLARSLAIAGRSKSKV